LPEPTALFHHTPPLHSSIPFCPLPYSSISLPDSLFDKKEQAREKGSGGWRHGETEGEGESDRTGERKGGRERRKRGEVGHEGGGAGGKFVGYLGTEQKNTGETKRDMHTYATYAHAQRAFRSPSRDIFALGAGESDSGQEVREERGGGAGGGAGGGVGDDDRRGAYARQPFTPSTSPLLESPRCVWV